MSSDLISRQAAVERFDYIRPRDPMTNDYTHGIDVGIALCKVAIREQPPAQLGTNLASLGTDAISKQQAIDALRKLREEDIEDYGCEIPEGFNQDHLDRATFAIKQLPPSQPAEPQIIRCKDCENWDTTWTNDFSPNYHYCLMVDGVRKEDWFCADAERRTDG